MGEIETVRGQPPPAARRRPGLTTWAP